MNTLYYGDDLKVRREFVKDESADRTGIDITHLSVGLRKLRLRDSFGLLPINEKRSGSAASKNGRARPRP
jgi:hypothetical protein